MKYLLLGLVISRSVCDFVRDVFEASLLESTQLVLTESEKEDYFALFNYEINRNTRKFSVSSLKALFEDTRPAILSSLVDEINNNEYGWQSEKSDRFKRLTIKDAKVLMGTILEPYEDLEPKNFSLFSDIDLPKYFDSRERWPECQSISLIRDQSNCGSCWAFASTEAFNDRLCISSNGTFKHLLSPQHTTSCCNLLKCMSFGCNGGQPANAWRWFVRNGLVTGNDYVDHDDGLSCWRYEFAPCHHHGDPENTNLKPCSELDPTPQCRKECLDTKYGTNFREDKYFATNAYSIKGIDNIKREIYTNGPVTAAFMVYEDFLAYRGGVYEHKKGAFLGGHAIKLIGWGEENGVEYWIAANSWNTNWGENGYFKIKIDDCNISGMVSAGDVNFADAKKSHHHDHEVTVIS